MEKFVYHSSSISGLEMIRPSVSTHYKKWVYATKDIVMTAVFLGTLGGDLTCQVGRDKVSGLPYICERLKGAFEKRYNEVKGYIYTLSAAGFLENQTSWDEEVVCPGEVPVLHEVKIDNAKEYLLSLTQQGKLIIKYYPDRIDDIPDDDNDLVMKCISWIQDNPRYMELVEKFQPNLVERIKSGLIKIKI